MKWFKNVQEELFEREPYQDSMTDPLYYSLSEDSDGSGVVKIASDLADSLYDSFKESYYEFQRVKQEVPQSVVGNEDGELEKEITQILEKYENSLSMTVHADSDILQDTEVDTEVDTLAVEYRRLYEMDVQIGDLLKQLEGGDSDGNVNETLTVTSEDEDDIRSKYFQLADELAGEMDSNVKIYKAYYRLALSYRRIKADNLTMKKLGISSTLVLHLEAENKRLLEIQEHCKLGMNTLEQQNKHLVQQYKDKEAELDLLAQTHDNSMASKKQEQLQIDSENLKLAEENAKLSQTIEALKKQLMDQRGIESLEKSVKQSDKAIVKLRDTVSVISQEKHQVTQRTNALEAEVNDLRLKLAKEQSGSSLLIQKYSDKEKLLLSEIGRLKSVNGTLHLRGMSDDLYSTKHNYRFGMPVNNNSVSSSSRSNSVVSIDPFNQRNAEDLYDQDGYDDVRATGIMLNSASMKSLSRKPLPMENIEEKQESSDVSFKESDDSADENGQESEMDEEPNEFKQPGSRIPLTSSVSTNSLKMINSAPLYSSNKDTALTNLPLKSYSDLSSANGGHLQFETNPDGSPRWVSKPRIDVKTNFFQKHRRSQSLLSASSQIPRSNSLYAKSNNVFLDNDKSSTGGLYQRKFNSVNNIKKYNE